MTRRPVAKSVRPPFEKDQAKAALRRLKFFPRTASVVEIDGKWCVALTLLSARRLAAKFPDQSNALVPGCEMSPDQMRQRIANLERILENHNIDSGKTPRIEVIGNVRLGKRAPGSYGSGSR